MLVHLEHGHLLFAEYRLQLAVGQDLAPVRRVLQLVLLDVVPDLAHHLAARQGPGPDHRRQLLGRLQRLLQPAGLVVGALLRSCRVALGFGRHGRPLSHLVPSGLVVSWPAPPRLSIAAGREHHPTSRIAAVPDRTVHPLKAEEIVEQWTNCRAGGSLTWASHRRWRTGFTAIRTASGSSEGSALPVGLAIKP